MCIYVYMYICICVHIYIYVCIYICIHTGRVEAILPGVSRLANCPTRGVVTMPGCAGGCKAWRPHFCLARVGAGIGVGVLEPSAVHAPTPKHAVARLSVRSLHDTACV